MAKKTEETKEIVKEEKNPILDMLAGYSEEEIAELAGSTGLDEIPPERRRHPLIVWNIDARDEDGTRIVPNLFFDCRSKQQMEEIDCALIFIREDFEYKIYDSKTGENELICRSHDKITGIRYSEDEKQYKCMNCPYRRAKKGEKRPCSTVARVAAMNLETNEPFVLFVKSTSYIPLLDYVERTFFGKLTVGKRKMDLPLYMVKTKLTLAEQTHGAKISYRLEPSADGFITDKSLVMAMKEVSESFKQMGAQEMMEVDEEPEQQQEGGFNPEQGGYDQEENINYESTPPPIDDDDVPF